MKLALQIITIVLDLKIDLKFWTRGGVEVSQYNDELVVESIE